MPTTDLQTSPAAAHTANDAAEIRGLMREAEAVSDELIQTCAKLKVAMIKARRNPAIAVSTGQLALLRLSDAEAKAMGLSTSLLRVHDALSRVAKETAGVDETFETPVAADAISER